MRQYLDMLEHVMNNGVSKGDRTGTGTKSVFGYQMRFNLQDGFPAVTTKKLYMRSVIGELLWFLKGTGNIEYLAQNNIHIWDEWPYEAYLKKNKLPVPATTSDEWTAGMKLFIERIATDREFAREWGDLGPVYGVQWRKWPDGKGGHIDQIAQAIELLKHNPNSRRIIISAWNVAEIDEIVETGGLPPCHTLFQFYVADGRLSCQLYQRSCDSFLGVPFNIASYALLMHIIAAEVGLEVGDFVWTGGDVHIYNNHFEQVKTQLAREPRALPKLVFEKKALEDYEISDFTLEGYDPLSPIKAPIAV